MTVGTGHFVFRNRMMRELGELHLDLYVTPCAEFLLVMSTDFLLGALVKLVAVKATHII